jgi:hypothetical protein
MSKNKPCPFCGSKNLEIPTGCVYVECKHCGAYGPSADTHPFSLTQREVVMACAWDKWNERNEVQKTENP